MYEQHAGGFERYSVDDEWRVPHVEKMLYDQGQLVATLDDVYRLTRDESLANTIRHTLDLVERDLMVRDPDAPGFGTFSSGEDADSDGEEGTFYVWTKAELAVHLSDAERTAIEHYYGFTDAGNFEAILKTSGAKSDKEAGYVLPEGSNVTFHIAHDGASLSFQRLESVKFDGEMLYAKGSKQTVAMVVSDVFAVSLEGAGGQPQRRPAGF